jgi:hypothetical protein
MGGERLTIQEQLLGAPSSDSMLADLRNKRRNNPAEEFGEEEEQGGISLL